MSFYAVIIHFLIINCRDCGVETQMEAVKREWWNVVMENEWELKTVDKKRRKTMYRKYLKRWLDFVIVLCAGCHLFDIGFSHLVWYKNNK